MRKIISSLLFVAALLTACEKISVQDSNVVSDQENPAVEQDVVFEAFTENSTTKTSLSKNGAEYDVLWNSGDKIKVNGTELTIQTENQPAGYGPGYTKANFAGNQPSKDRVSPFYRAYFPASMHDNAVTGGWFLPENQTYVPRSIKDAPMYAASDDESLAFKNLCGVIRLNLKGDRSISTISLFDRADSPKALSGRFTVSDNTAVVQGNDGVSLQCAEPVKLSTSEATPFMISVPAGSYERLQITILAQDGSICKLTSNKPIVVERALITDINISNPNFKNENAVITYTTTNDKQINAYLNPGKDASVFGKDLTVVSHTYDAATNTGVITLSGSATCFGYQAFYNKSNLKTITFPESITSVDDQAFYLCTGLESFDLSHISSIGVRAFQGAKLNGLVIPENVQSIAERAFMGIKSTSVEIKGEPETMGTYIFDSSDLETATIDRKIAVPAGLFNNCRSLKEVNFKEGAFSLGDSAFENCRAFVTTITLPSGVKALGANLFRYCYSLEGVIIPDSVETIGSGAFQDCAALTGITIPGAVTTIGASAFQGCSSIVEITVPNSVTTIGNNAFYQCTALKTVDIGTGVITIGGTVLRFSNAVESLTIRAPQVPALATTLNGSNPINIYVPTSLVDAYKAAKNWSTYADTIRAITE